ncbi:unnamed protein product [Lymnaea stagnalis]|uniref:BTB domain-containing protein n=1 Tax=Lymnaea stagnalis TaxID=6523 RepID=A0AAV2HTI6_LYMST
MVKSSIACGLQACLGQRWTNDDYSDFTVVVEDKEFPCHKFILGACSTVLNGLLHSNMIETIQNKANIHNMSKETFTVILNAIYKGEDGLTENNVIQVWHATHFLDIRYLVKECEYFVKQNMTLSNFEEFYHHAILLNSESVGHFAKRFMINNFEDIWESTTFLNLSFEDIYMIIEDHFLSAKSEDIVVEAVIKWVNHQAKKDHLEKNDERRKDGVRLDTVTISNNENDVLQDGSIRHHDKECSEMLTNSFRECSTDTKESEQNDSVNVLTRVSHATDLKLSSTYFNMEEKLTKLLKAARLCLASRERLEKLMVNPLITSNPEASKVVYESLLFHWKASCYSSHYIVRHRECSGLSNVMVFITNGIIKVYSLQRQCFYTIYNFNDRQENKPYTTGIAAINSKIFFITNDRSEKYNIIYKLLDPDLKEWTVVAKSDKSLNGVLLSHQDKLINVPDNDAVFVTANDACFVHITISRMTVEAATIVNDNILAFCSSYNSKEIIRYNMITKKKTNLPNIDGPYKNISSFQQDENVYILQQDGSLWELLVYPDDDIIFSFLDFLWDGEKSIKGVACYSGQLFIFCYQRSNESLTSLVTDGELQTEMCEASELGVFKSIQFVISDFDTQVIPMTVSTDCLSKGTLG